ncbi:hypothetical protein Pst134EB_030786 [Puccinia striiformis f. sp. tritici]|nr:hypothetical protein Pst134EB_030786 [Puccinia striiformis f. sp. tritici]
MKTSYRKYWKEGLMLHLIKSTDYLQNPFQLASQPAVIFSWSKLLSPPYLIHPFLIFLKAGGLHVVARVISHAVETRYNPVQSYKFQGQYLTLIKSQLAI